MAIYMADRHLPGITLEQLLAAQKAAIETSKRFTAGGRPVRYIRSSWVPSEAHVMSLFEAENPQSVRDVNEAAGIPFTRILEAVDLAEPNRTRRRGSGAECGSQGDGGIPGPS